MLVVYTPLIFQDFRTNLYAPLRLRLRLGQRSPRARQQRGTAVTPIPAPTHDQVTVSANGGSMELESGAWEGGGRC